MKHFFSEPFVTIAHLDSRYIQNLSIFRTQDNSKYRESLKYSSDRALCNLGITTLAYSSSSTHYEKYPNFT